MFVESGLLVVFFLPGDLTNPWAPTLGSRLLVVFLIPHRRNHPTAVLLGTGGLPPIPIKLIVLSIALTLFITGTISAQMGVLNDAGRCRVTC